MRIALGPVQYYWPRETLEDFYQRMASGPVDCVYLGETVCSKRRALRPDEWLELARSLREAGKEVIISTLTLIEAGSELGVVKRLCGNGEFTVEANDLAAVQLLADQKVRFVTGPALNIYNAHSLRALVRMGLKRWVMPPEMSRQSLGELLDEAERLGVREGLETEVFSYGRLALAYSARCFTARHHNLPKDRCELRCLDDPDGIALKTQEGEEFLTVNGIQTQSGRIYNLLNECHEMAAMGVDLMRISPQHGRTEAAIATLHAKLNGQPDALDDTPPCNGFWHGAPGMEQVSGTETI